MSTELPRLFLTRHGDTDWTEQRKHTGRTDIPLNVRGEARARQLGEQLRRFEFLHVFTSPLQRASRTCDVAGYRNVATTNHDLVEWDYGEFEGLLTKEFVRRRPGWELFRDGCPGGESPDEVAVRADRFIARVRAMHGDILAFSSGHIIRMIAARWIGLSPDLGRCFYCRPASVGILGYEHHSAEEPMIALWNYVRVPSGSRANLIS
jgi:probable phosphoglycerate mutase